MHRPADRALLTDQTREPQVRGSFHGTRCTPFALYSRTYVLFCAILFFSRFGREGADVNAFNRYAPFIQDFIYAHDWENLRSIQVAAADAIFNTEDNVLLTASTASGKTEAAFFPHPHRVLGEPAGNRRGPIYRPAQGPHQRSIPAARRPLRGSGDPGLAMARRRLLFPQGEASQKTDRHPANHTGIA